MIGPTVFDDEIMPTDFPFDASSYGPTVATLLADDCLPAIGPGRPNEAARSQLAALSDATIFTGKRILNPHQAACCRSGLWLLHDFLDESHRLSQDIETPEGSFWHGIMHRREGDFGNAKYWFRRVGRHSIFAELGRRAAILFADDRSKATASLHSGTWDAYAFIDYCELLQTNRLDDALARRIAREEWRLLFEACYHGAIGE